MSGPEISAIPKEARAFQGQSAGVVSRVVANTPANRLTIVGC